MNAIPNLQKRGHNRPQFGLRTVMLLIAATAAWTAWYTGQKSIQRDVQAISEIYHLQPELLQRELYIRDQNEYACLLINNDPDTHEYRCYLPLGRKYNLQFMSSKVFGLYDKSLTADLSWTIPEGEHQISLKELPGKWIVSVDGEVVMDIPRKRPASQSNVSTGVSDRFDSQWYEMGQPLTLRRQLETNNGKSQNRAPGIALWIETAD